MRGALVSLALALGVSACAGIGSSRPGCAEGPVRIDQTGPGSPGSACTRLSAAHFELLITPEAEPINPSPWYAFAVRSDRRAEVVVTLRYAAADHRYAPWISDDDGAWARLEDHRVEVSGAGDEARLTLEVEPGRTRVAAQPLYLDADYQALEMRWGGGWRTIGSSVEGRDIRARIEPPSSPDAGWILLMGRQHPPEVPGAWAFEAFAETLVAARASGALEAGLIVAPLLNPDGVAAGRWRLNSAGMDLNRDWTDRTQPEVSAIYALLDALEIAPGDLTLMVDFHATRADYIYLPQPEELPAPVNAELEAWLAAMEADALFELIEPRRTNPARRVSAKAAFTDAFGAVAVTWEAGDGTDEARVRDTARRGAEAWMRRETRPVPEP